VKQSIFLAAGLGLPRVPSLKKETESSSLEARVAEAVFQAALVATVRWYWVDILVA
jgi:hypothetical protein